MSDKATIGVVAQALNDHLADCTRERQDTNRRLGRIESVMMSVACAVILQLLAVVSFLFAKVLHWT